MDFASDGQEALNAISARPFDVVMLDAQMPFFTGPEVAASVTSNWNLPWPQPHLIALSADCAKEDTAVWRSSGVLHCLCKPLTKPALQRCLELIDQGSAHPFTLEEPHVPEGLVDWTGLDQLHTHLSPKGDDAAFNRVFTKFLNEVVAVLESMRDAGAQHGTDRQMLHKLKGLLGFMYMTAPLKLVAEARQSPLLQDPIRRQEWVTSMIQSMRVCADEVMARYSMASA